MSTVPGLAPLAVKICGLTDIASVDAALDAGADLIGLVFFPPSPRNVSIELGAALAERARGRAEIVALTVDAAPDLLDEIVTRVRPTLLQFHGKETPETIAATRARTGCPVMKAIGISGAEDLAAIEIYREAADRLLLDAKAPKGATRPGGNGAAFDWTLLGALDRSFPFMLSGGLTPETVADAVATVRPAAVDVSSGVETAPGRKDPARIAAFVAAARQGVARHPESV
ncbi:phosphoribosylanthranilate isomerase [Amorphus sp. 3PC139-8]|uniref:phosphoribosylanthranilate isomerase n=1 Tax=Amorphus sp. 3PC139-8 TaxID=2735676 RepID=UPI00345CDD98